MVRPWCSWRWPSPTCAFGIFDNPYAGLVVFVVLPRPLPGRPAPDPVPGSGCSAASCVAPPDAAYDWPVDGFGRPKRPPDDPASSRRPPPSTCDPPPRRLRRPALDPIALVLRSGVPHADASAVHRLAERRPTRGWACVECHIGEGARAIVHYKLAGARQLHHVVTNQIPKPFRASPTCGRRSRSAAPVTRPTGDPAGHPRVRDYRGRRDEHRDRQRVEAPCRRPRTSDRLRPGDPWHADPRLRVKFVATDPDAADHSPRPGDQRATARPGIRPRRDHNRKQLAQGEQRGMDCVDCHSGRAPHCADTRAGRRRRLGAGRISRALPFVRREAVRLLKADYTDKDARPRRLTTGCVPSMLARRRDRAAQARSGGRLAADGVSQQRVSHHEGDVGRLPRQPPAHRVDGCFRRHDDGHKAKDGTTISGDCEVPPQGDSRPRRRRPNKGDPPRPEELLRTFG